MGLAYLHTLGWLTRGQWGGIYGSPMECFGDDITIFHTNFESVASTNHTNKAQDAAEVLDTRGPVRGLSPAKVQLARAL